MASESSSNTSVHNLGAEKRQIREARLVVVGDAGAGKTSLVRLLVGDQFEHDPSLTRGIDARRLVLSNEGNELSLSIWDFGDQEIMYATHELFMSRGSLYLLVFDSRRNGGESRLLYWLRLIRVYAGDAPIILATTRIDVGSVKLPLDKLRSAFPQIRAYVETSSKTGTGAFELKNAIMREAAQLPSVRDEWPTAWHEVKERLARLEVNFITAADFSRLCEDAGIGDESSRASLAATLNDLGLVLHVPDDPALNEFFILRPEWVTAGVSRILASDELREAAGVLDDDLLRRILPPPEYADQDQRLLVVRLLERLERAFQISDEGGRQTFLLPDLLPRTEPDVEFDKDHALRLQYNYDILPASVIARLIVRLGQSFHRPTFWRNGIEIGDEQNQALIRADPERRVLGIWVTGEESTRLGYHFALARRDAPNREW